MLLLLLLLLSVVFFFDSSQILLALILIDDNTFRNHRRERASIICASLRLLDLLKFRADMRVSCSKREKRKESRSRRPPLAIARSSEGGVGNLNKGVRLKREFAALFCLPMYFI